MKWIAIKERRPHKSCWVFGAHTGTGFRGYFLSYNAEGDVFNLITQVDGLVTFVPPVEITHWIELPYPPGWE